MCTNVKTPHPGKVRGAYERCMDRVAGILGVCRCVVVEPYRYGELGVNY